MKKNKNRRGYRETKFGWIPEGWIRGLLDDCVRSDAPICYGILMPGAHTPGGVPVIKVTNIRNGELHPDCLQHTTPEIDGKYVRSRLMGGDLLLSIRGSTGDLATVPACLAGANITQDTARIRLRADVSRKYINYSLQGPVLQKQIRTHTIGQAVKGINIGEVRKLKIPLPTVPEQEAIAGVLECWDKAIRGTEKKIEKKRQIKKGLMQQLLTGKRRLPGFKGAWEKVRLGEIVSVRKGEQLNRLEQTATGAYPVLNGGIEAKGYTNTWNSEADVITISEGGNSCGYVNLNRHRFWCGGHCYALSDKAELVSKHYLYQFLKFKQASVMRLRVGTGLPNIQKKSLEKFMVLRPPINEQHAIAAVLTSADSEITNLIRKLNVLKDQKHYLLNNLVTGSIRLPRFAKRRKIRAKGGRA